MLGDKMTTFLDERDKSSLADTGRAMRTTVKHDRAMQSQRTLELDTPTASQLISLAKNYPKTTIISIGDYKHLTDRDFAAVAQLCPRLERLTLGQSTSRSILGHQLSDITLYALAQHCSHLRDLYVDGPTLFSDDGMRALGAGAEATQWQQGCPELRELVFGSDEVSLLGMKAVLEGCPHLEIFVETKGTLKVPLEVVMPNRGLWRFSPKVDANHTNGVRSADEAALARAWLRTLYPSVGSGFLTPQQRSELRLRC